MKWVFSYLKPLTGRICGGITVKIIGTLAELLIPFLLSHILENVIETNDIGAILFYGGLMAVCALIAGLGNIIANRMAAKTTIRNCYNTGTITATNRPEGGLRFDFSLGR